MSSTALTGSKLWENDELISRALDSSEILEISHRKLCSLWAGYGSVVAIKVRYLPHTADRLDDSSTNSVDHASVESGRAKWLGTGEISRMSEIASERVARLVCKSISPPPGGKGISHERKVQSYFNEAAFYAHHSERARLEGGINLAEVYHLTSDRSTGVCSFLLSDLREVYPIAGGGELMNLEVRAAVDWLAQFHAFFWEQAHVWTASDSSAVVVAEAGAASDVSTGEEPEASATAAKGSKDGAERFAIDGPEQKLWEEGCYWRLDTRMAEHENISSEWARVKNAAFAIAALLKDGTSAGSGEDEGQEGANSNIKVRNDSSFGLAGSVRFKTLVHGDCKAANMMFRAQDERTGREAADTARIFFTYSSATENEKEEYDGSGGGDDDDNESGGLMARMQCVMYDFQYTGGGYGARDLAKLMVSSVGLRRDCLSDGKDVEKELLSYYHRQLCRYMAMYKDRFSPLTLKRFYREYTLELLQKHYELCLLDFVRFMQGWGLWGNTIYAEARCLELLHGIDGGKCLSVDQYHQLFQKHYCG